MSEARLKRLWSSEWVLKGLKGLDGFTGFGRVDRGK